MGILLDILRTNAETVKTVVEISLNQIDFWERSANWEEVFPNYSDITPLPTKEVNYPANERTAMKGKSSEHIQFAIDKLVLMKNIIDNA